uniref:Uncharacterized protein n=1 Tax=Arundo donax TaxID=35708 RepID=A0A0A8YCI8_ARUDO
MDTRGDYCSLDLFFLLDNDGFNEIQIFL